MIADPSAARVQIDRLAKSSPAVVRLAELASLASRIETGLLRQLRLEMVPEADAGTEADLWFGPLVATRDSGGIALRVEVAEVLRQRVATDPDRCRLAREIVERRHAGTNPAQELEERLTFLALQPSAPAIDATISDELRTAVKAMVDDPSRTSDLARWAVRAVPRLPARVRDTTAAWTLGLTAAAHLDGRPVLEGKPPDGALDDLQSLLPSRPGIPVGVRAIVGGVELSLPPDPRAEAMEAAPTDPVLVDVQVGGGKVRTESLRQGGVVTLDGGGPFSVRVTGTDGSGVALEVPLPDIVLLVGEDLERAAKSAPTGKAIDRPDLIEARLPTGSPELKDIEEAVQSWRDRMPEPREVLRIGERLGRLLPEQFWDLLRNSVAERPPSVLVLTDRGDIPWEVATATTLTGGRWASLGMVADLAIWLLPQGSGGPDEPFPLAMHCGTIVAAAVGPEGSPNLPRLGYAEGEAARLRDGHGAVTIQPTAADLFPWLEGRFPCDLLHIASQGGFDTERGLTVIGLADGGFLDARTDVRIDLAGTIVVLNAPNAADPVLVERLLVGGAGAVIAPRWTVEDRLAAELVGILYDAAFDGNLPLGAALREARQRAAASSEDSTPLAYALYGHPATLLKRRPGAIAWDLSGDRPRGRPLIGHARPITALAWSPDGTRIYTASEDGALWTWDARTARLTDQHVAAVPVDFLSSGTSGWIATLSAGGDGRIWPPTGADPRFVSLVGTGTVEDVAWSPDSERAAFAVEFGNLAIADRDARVEALAIPGTPTKLAWTARRLLAVGTSEGATHLVSADSHQVLRTYREDRDPISALAVSTDGLRLATVAGTMLRVWDLVTGSHLGASPVPETVLAISATGTGFRLVTQAGRILDWQEGGDAPPSEVARIAPAALAAFGPGGTRLVTVAGSAAPEPEPQAQYASAPPP